MSGRRAFKIVDPSERCLWDWDPETGFHSCHRRSLPGRRLCHKHAATKARVARDRRRRKAARRG